MIRIALTLSFERMFLIINRCKEFENFTTLRIVIINPVTIISNVIALIANFIEKSEFRRYSLLIVVVMMRLLLLLLLVELMAL